jgi:hypothetical protein
LRERVLGSAASPVSYEHVGELTGTWSGTWGGTPMTLVIVEHTEGVPYSGLYFGPWLIAGGRYPGIAGVLTYASSGAPNSKQFKGWATRAGPSPSASWPNHPTARSTSASAAPAPVR